MKQYCRYCTHLCVNNFPWCKEHQTELSEGYTKVPNRCKDFDFNEIDAYGETKGYKPRQRQAEEVSPLQLTLE